jgi:hypothetical protein
MVLSDARLNFSMSKTLTRRRSLPLTPAYDTWVMRDQQVVSYLVNSLAEDVLPHVFGLSTAAAVWRPLNDLYAA